MPYCEKIFNDLRNCNKDHISDNDIKMARLEILGQMGHDEGWDYELDQLMLTLLQIDGE